MRRDELQILVQPLLDAEGLELVECQVSGGRRLRNIRLTVDRLTGDGEQRVDIDLCANLSRQLARLLDADPILRDAYSLEVSTPGMNRPIWSQRHFERFVGERVRLELSAPAGSPAHLSGRIGPWENDGFWLELEPTGRRHVALLEVRDAHLQIDPWEKARAARRKRDSDRVEAAET